MDGNDAPRVTLPDGSKVNFELVTETPGAAAN
jgi:hypothetical protein